MYKNIKAKGYKKVSTCRSYARKSGQRKKKPYRKLSGTCAPIGR